MKIDDRLSNYMELLNGEAAKPAVRPAELPESHPETETPTVAVDLSPAAVQLAEDEARRERLENIRRQLAEGSYNISGKDVADKIIKILKS